MQKVSEEVLICMCFRDAKILIRQETFCLTRNAYLAKPPRNPLLYNTTVPVFLGLTRKHLFTFCKRSLPFLTVDEANNTFLNSLRKNDADAQVEFMF